MAGNLIGQDDCRILPVLLAMLAVGVLVGLLNGVATTLLGVPSFIVTLGMMLALSGFVFYLTGGAATGNPSDNFRSIGTVRGRGRAGHRPAPLPAGHPGGARGVRRLADAPALRHAR